MSTSGRKAQVLYDYASQDDDQLSINAGDIITIIDDSADLNGWALAQNGSKEGYVPAEYVRYIGDGTASSAANPSSNATFNTSAHNTGANPHNASHAHNDYDYDAYTNTNTNTDGWKPAGFESFYHNVLSQEHHLPFTFKLCKSMRDVLIPCPCSRYGYVMSRPDLRRGAMFSLLISFIVSAIDTFSILSPIIPLNEEEKLQTIHYGQWIVFALNLLFRIILSLIFLNRYPRPNLIFVSFPALNVCGALTHSIRVYETLEMGDNKEYDGYRFYRTWMWSSLMNLPFNIISAILVIINISNGLIAVSVFVVIWNLLNVGRCFLASWANVESGKDIHPDFAETIKKYHL